VRISNLIRQMSTFAEVWLLVLGEATDDETTREAYEPLCRRVLFHPISRGAARRGDPWGLMPPSPSPYSDPAVSRRISDLVDAHGLDVVQLEFAELGAHVRRRDGAKTILVEHDLCFETQRRQRSLDIGHRFDATGSLGVDALDDIRQERFELRACTAADQVHCMSDRDRRILASRLTDAAHLRVIPNGVDTEVYHPGPAADRRGVLFFGSFPHLPNLDAFEYLVEEIWPDIRRRTPDARLTVAGARPPAAVLDHDGRDGIRVVGEVDQAAPLYRDHRVLLVPLRSGSGTRLKILEALASGLPVVSTSLGAEGLELSNPPELTAADTPAAMAEAVTALLAADDGEIQSIGERGRSLVTASYDWMGIGERVRSALEELVAVEPSRGELRAAAPEPPARDDDPDLSVVVVARTGQDLGPELAAALEAPAKDRTCEAVVVHCGSPTDAVARWRARGFRVVSVEGADAEQAPMLNAGAAAARGRILVFTAADAIPAGDDWLKLITAPFDHDRAPAAVQGGITHQLEDGIPAHDPDFTRERRRWKHERGGIAFDLANAAMPKAVWEAFPFPPDAAVAMAWQHTAADHGMLIIPCHAAAVRFVRAAEFADVFKGALDDGRAMRRFGVRPTLGDLADDLRHPMPALTADGEPAPPHPDYPQKDFAVARALGLFLGARFPGR
jgi:glycosyltransferase involved in cell wall biosynthesis